MQLKKTKNLKNNDSVQNDNLVTIRLKYFRRVRKLRLIEYFKNAQIKPEWMIIYLLPVLPPDLRPIISNSRGFITGDINTLYQNIIYWNNLMERLSRVFWNPKKLMSFEQIFSLFQIYPPDSRIFSFSTISSLESNSNNAARWNWEGKQSNGRRQKRWESSTIKEKNLEENRSARKREKKYQKNRDHHKKVSFFYNLPYSSIRNKYRKINWKIISPFSTQIFSSFLSPKKSIALVSLSSLLSPPPILFITGLLFFFGAYPFISSPFTKIVNGLEIKALPWSPPTERSFYLKSIYKNCKGTWDKKKKRSPVIKRIGGGDKWLEREMIDKILPWLIKNSRLIGGRATFKNYELNVGTDAKIKYEIKKSVRLIYLISFFQWKNWAFSHIFPHQKSPSGKGWAFMPWNIKFHGIIRSESPILFPGETKKRLLLMRKNREGNNREKEELNINNTRDKKNDKKIFRLYNWIENFNEKIEDKRKIQKLFFLPSHPFFFQNTNLQKKSPFFKDLIFPETSFFNKKEVFLQRLYPKTFPVSPWKKETLLWRVGGINNQKAERKKEKISIFSFPKKTDESKDNHLVSDSNAFLKKVIKKYFFNHISKNYISLHNLNDSKPLEELKYALYKSVNSLIDNSQKMQSNNLLQKGRPCELVG